MVSGGGGFQACYSELFFLELQGVLCFVEGLFRPRSSGDGGFCLQTEFFRRWSYVEALSVKKMVVTEVRNLVVMFKRNHRQQ